MRVTTSLKYEVGISQFNRLQSQQMQLYEQITSGRRVVRPGDDPLAAAQAVTVSQNQSLNDRYTTNRSVANQSLGMADTAIQNSVDIMDNIKARLVQAGNASYSDTEMRALGATLASSYSALLTQANATDGNGVYLFSGNKGDTAPYVTGSDGYIVGDYQGDAGKRLVQVDQTRQLSTSNTADEVFGTVFNDLQGIITALQNYDSSTGDTAAFQATLKAAQDGVNTTFDNMVTVQASVGARQNEISALDSIGESRKLSYQSQYNSLVNIDEASAYSMMTYYETALQASLQSFMKIQSLNLFSIG